MTDSPMLYEMHMHTPMCHHAFGEPQDYAQVAEQRGLKGIVVTCHNPTNDGWSPTVRMSVDEFGEYVDLVDQAALVWRGRVDVRLGLESDYVPGMEPWLEELHAMAPLNHVLGSVHPHLPQYKERFHLGDIEQFQRTYFEHLALAAESGLFDTLGHPDLVKNIEPEAYDLPRLMGTICDTLDRIAAAGTAMELNTSGLNKVVPEMNPAPEILREMRQRNIPVVIGADAHKPERVAADFVQALDTLGAAGYSTVSNFLNRERIELPIDAVRASLAGNPA
jgi:histidinol-phosphatase (PHP family)